MLKFWKKHSKFFDKIVDLDEFFNFVMAQKGQHNEPLKVVVTAVSI